MISAAEALELFCYTPANGVLTWRNTRGRIKAGCEAGSVTSEGYRAVCVARQRYYVHRIIWLITYGTFPVSGNDVDHVNGNRSDNRINNLRSVTRSQNGQNQHRGRAGKTSKHIGVCWMARDKKWAAYIKVGGRRLSLGYHVTEGGASSAYLAAKAQYHIGAQNALG